MDGQDINVNLPEGTKELVLREGKAPDILQPVKLTFDGHITSPGNYSEFKFKHKIFDEKTAHVVVDKRTYSIKLVEDERSEKATVITGKVKINPDLLAFNISPIAQSKGFNKTELVRLIKFNKRHFTQVDEHKKLMEGLAEFAYKREVTGVSADDQKGNFKEMYEQKLKQNVKLDFKLTVPIFEGFDEKTFKVEIIPDATDSSVTFYLESVELKEQFEKDLDKIFDAEIKRFKGLLILYS